MTIAAALWLFGAVMWFAAAVLAHRSGSGSRTALNACVAVMYVAVAMMHLE